MPKVIQKETIFDAALDCFTRKGYYKATMAHIAQKAGISKPALYAHFDSKDDLFVRLFSYLGDKYFQQSLAHYNFIRVFRFQIPPACNRFSDKRYPGLFCGINSNKRNTG